MAIPITALTAGILGIMSLVLAFLAGSMRAKTGISIGDGGNQEMLLAGRRHANFAEFVPMALILLAVLELAHVSSTALYVLGGGLVLCRVAHAVGIKADTMTGPLRAIGAGGTTLITLVMSVWAIATFF